MHYLITITTQEGTLNCWAQTAASGRILMELLRTVDGITRLELRDTKKKELLLLMGDEN